MVEEQVIKRELRRHRQTPDQKGYVICSITGLPAKIPEAPGVNPE